MAGAISILNRADSDNDDVVSMEKVLVITEYSYNFPLEVELVAAEQVACNTSAEYCSLKPCSYSSKYIGGVEDIICKNDKKVVPETLQQRVMN